MGYDVRRIRTTDLETLRQIHNEQHDYEYVVPKIDRGSILISKDEQIVGAGFLRPILEAVMILDKTKPMRDKAYAFNQLMAHAVHDAQGLGVDRIFAWAKDDTFRNILVKHHNYEIVSGTSLAKRVD